MGERLERKACYFGAQVVALDGFGASRFDGPGQIQSIVDELLIQQILADVSDILEGNGAGAWVGHIEGGDVAAEQVVAFDFADEVFVFEVFVTGVPS